jgi:hypothetical protein
MSVQALYLHKQSPYTSPTRSTTATEFVPDKLLSRKHEFIPMVIKQIGKKANSLRAGFEPA